MTASEHCAIHYVYIQQPQMTEKVIGVPAGGDGACGAESYVVITLMKSALIQHTDSAVICDGWLYFCTNQFELSPGRLYGNVDNRRGPFRSYRGTLERVQPCESSIKMVKN
ncbi:hypothetical protein K432DRAFT_469914 [Lepidopterella palustris CBS 459.81]|uniref:Uncharacterized protein n=1 Tax=Lepidopterella palustris CBS 459.81 TaxID=1314670 RepID=A0A8E2DZ49_9PEZI|nr:hypothetical protein K432DRAFT_469914 [Lepidopterella palustris CBS 459.81]